jgi:hypothetical protein
MIESQMRDDGEGPGRRATRSLGGMSEWNPLSCVADEEEGGMGEGCAIGIVNEAAPFLSRAFSCPATETRVSMGSSSPPPPFPPPYSSMTPLTPLTPL